MSKKHKKQREDYEPERKESSQDNDDEISINFKDIGRNLKGLGSKAKASKFNNQTLLTWVIIIIIMLSAFYIRSYAFNFPITDDWATSTVEVNLKNSIASNVRSQRPDLPEASISVEVEKQYQQFYSQNKAQLDAQKKQLSQQFKDEMKDANGTPYLSDIDSYLWYSYAKWYQRTGFFGNEIINGKEAFTLRNGRLGQGVGFIMPSWLISMTQDIFQIFNQNQDIMATSFFVTPLIMMLAVIPAFFLGRKIGGLSGGIIAAAMIGTMPSIMGRTISADIDYFTFVFPFLILWLMLEALEAKTWTGRIVYGAATGLSVAVFRMSWTGWWFTAGLVGAIAGIYIIYKAVEYVLRKRKFHGKEIWDKSRPAFIFIGIYLVSLVIFLSILALLLGLNPGQEILSLARVPLEPINFVLGFKGAATGVGVGGAEFSYPLWPNVFTTVAELNPGSYNELVAAAGGVPFFIVAIIGILALIAFKKVEGKHYPFYGILLAVWFVATYYAGLIGIRFTALFAPVVAFAIAGLVGLLIHYYLKPAADALGIKAVNLLKFFVFVILLWIFVLSNIHISMAISKGNLPMYDDAWERSMQAIQKDSTKAIITSWWDFGHWFQARSERSVTFDGGDQGKRIHWVGLSLLTSDEHESVDILKMLNCGQEHGYDELLADLKDPYKTTLELKKIIRLSKEDADNELKDQGVAADRRKVILNLTHCDDLYKMYYITSDDMIGKAGVWAHFGSWNFTRAYFYYKLRNEPLDKAIIDAKNTLGMSNDEARKLYVEVQNIFDERTANDWIATWPNYVTGSPVPCKYDNRTNLVVCTYNIGIGQQSGLNVVLSRGLFNLTDLNKSAMLIQAINPQTGQAVSQSTSKPAGIAIAGEDGIERINTDDGSFPYDMFLFQNEAGEYQSLIMHPSLTNSLFTKLYFLDGKYTHYFEKLSDESGFRGNKIITYKVIDPDAVKKNEQG